MQNLLARTFNELIEGNYVIFHNPREKIFDMIMITFGFTAFLGSKNEWKEEPPKREELPEPTSFWALNHYKSDYVESLESLNQTNAKHLIFLSSFIHFFEPLVPRVVEVRLWINRLHES